MEASFMRLLGNQLQRSIIIKSGASGFKANGGSKLFRHHGEKGITGRMSFSVSSNIRRQQDSTYYENVVKQDRELNLPKGVTITDYLFQDLQKWSNATAMVSNVMYFTPRYHITSRMNELVILVIWSKEKVIKFYSYDLNGSELEFCLITFFQRKLFSRRFVH